MLETFVWLSDPTTCVGNAPSVRAARDALKRLAARGLCVEEELKTDKGRPRTIFRLNPQRRIDNRAPQATLRESRQYFAELAGDGLEFALGMPYTSTYGNPVATPSVHVYVPSGSRPAWRFFLPESVSLLRFELHDATPEMLARLVVRGGIPLLSAEDALVEMLSEHRETGSYDALLAAVGIVRTRRLRIKVVAQRALASGLVEEANVLFRPLKKSMPASKSETTELIRLAWEEGAAAVPGAVHPQFVGL